MSDRVIANSMGKMKGARKGKAEPFVGRQWLLVALLGLIAFLAFASGVDGPWIADDEHIILTNPYVQSFEYAAKWLTGSLFPDSAERQNVQFHFYRPLITATYALDWSWGGGSPIAFHLSNLLAHALVTIAAFFTLTRWTRNQVVSFWAAALFSLHPAKANSVAWITGRPDVYLTLFLLLSCYFHFRLRSSPRGVKRGFYLFAKWASAGLALASKETAVTLPLFLMLEELAFLQKRALSLQTARQLIGATVPAILLVLIYLIGRAWILPLSADAEGLIPWTARFTRAAQTNGKLMGYLFWPQDLSIFSAFTDAERRSPLSGSTFWIGLTTLVGFASAAVFTFRRRLLLPFALLVLFGVCLIPTLNVVPGQSGVVPQPRYLYLPSLPFFAFWCWWGRDHEKWLTLTAGPLLILFIALSWQRAAVFSDSEEFWKEELQHNPTSPTVVQSIVNFDKQEYGRRVALRRAVCGLKWSENEYDLRAAEPLFILAVRILGEMQPADSSGSQSLIQFLANLRAGKAASIEGQVSLVPSPRLQATLRKAQSQLMAEEATLRWRNSEMSGAERLSREAIANCGDCARLRFQMAALALLRARLALADEWMLGVGGLFEERYVQARAQMVQANSLPPGPQQIVLHAQAAEILSRGEDAARLLEPHIEGLVTSQNLQLYQFAAVVFRKAGMIEEAQRFFHLLPPALQQLMREASWEAIPESPPQDFFAGTCAFPSEL